MTQMMKRYEMLLSQGRHRRTVQRFMILQVLEQAEEHITIEQLTERIQFTLPLINLSTIYRNLEILNQMGLIRTNHLPGEGVTYELIDGKPHAHLVCQHCHKVAHLDVSQLDTLQADFQANAHFQVVSLALTITGYCITCWNLLSSEKMIIMKE